MADTLVRCLTDTEPLSTEWADLSKEVTLAESSQVLSVSSGRRLMCVDCSRGPAWLKPTVEKICTLMRLGPGWDSYHGRSIDDEVVRFSLTMLSHLMGEATPHPQIVPTSHGGLQFEWHELGIDLEVEVAAPFQIQACFGNAHTGECWEKEFRRDLTQLAEAVRQLDAQQALAR